jgi:hypothetical protein
LAIDTRKTSGARQNKKAIERNKWGKTRIQIYREIRDTKSEQQINNIKSG